MGEVKDQAILLLPAVKESGEVNDKYWLFRSCLRNSGEA
jgi:hypothetical protein